MFKKITLKNGLRIITYPMKNTQAVTVLVLVGAGSRYETKDINGISHFLEHMFFKGTRKRPSTLKINEPLDRVGGIHNAFTDKEFTAYWAKVDFKHLDLALDWVSDVYLNSKLEEREIKKEKGTIIEEINMYLDMPPAYVGDLFEKLLYPNQPAGWQILGEKEIIRKLKRKDFINYLRNHYLAKNTLVCIVGNIDQKSIGGKIKKYFKGIKTGPAKAKLKVVEKQNQPQSLIHFKETDQTHLVLGVRSYNLFHPKRYIQEVLANILGGMFTSRLFLHLRDKKGLCYYVTTLAKTYTDSGYLVTSAGIDNKRVEEAIKIILKEYKKLKEKKVPKDELQKAKEHIKGHLYLGLETSDAWAVYLGTQEILKRKISTPEEVCKRIDKVSQADILKVAEDIFQPQKLNLALIGPHRDKTKLQQLLRF